MAITRRRATFAANKVAQIIALRLLYALIPVTQFAIFLANEQFSQSVTYFSFVLCSQRGEGGVCFVLATHDFIGQKLLKYTLYYTSTKYFIFHRCCYDRVPVSSLL